MVREEQTETPDGFWAFFRFLTLKREEEDDKTGMSIENREDRATSMSMEKKANRPKDRREKKKRESLQLSIRVGLQQGFCMWGQ